MSEINSVCLFPRLLSQHLIKTLQPLSILASITSQIWIKLFINSKHISNCALKFHLQWEFRLLGFSGCRKLKGIWATNLSKSHCSYRYQVLYHNCILYVSRKCYHYIELSKSYLQDILWAAMHDLIRSVNKLINVYCRLIVIILLYYLVSN